MKLLTKWLRALRSGKYKKCTGQLCEKEARCVLGVLCEVSKLGKWVDTCTYAIPGDDDSSCGLLIPYRIIHKIADETGLTDQVVGVKLTNVFLLNDSRSYWGFKRLARQIEKGFAAK